MMTLGVLSRLSVLDSSVVSVQVQVREVEHVCAVLHQLERVLVQIAVQVAAEDRGGRLGERAIDIHGEIGHGLHQLP